MTLKVTVLDVETGERGEATVADGDYLVVTASPCEVGTVQTYPLKRTAVVTLRGFAPRGKSSVNENVGAEQPTNEEAL